MTLNTTQFRADIFLNLCFECLFKIIKYWQQKIKITVQIKKFCSTYSVRLWEFDKSTVNYVLVNLYREKLFSYVGNSSPMGPLLRYFEFVFKYKF